MFGFVFWQQSMTQQLNSGTNSTGLVASLMLYIQQVLSFLLTEKRIQTQTLE